MPSTEHPARRRIARADFPNARIVDARGNVVQVEFKGRRSGQVDRDRSAAILLFTGVQRERPEPREWR